MPWSLLELMPLCMSGPWSSCEFPPPPHETKQNQCFQNSPSCSIPSKCETHLTITTNHAVPNTNNTNTHKHVTVNVSFFHSSNNNFWSKYNTNANKFKSKKPKSHHLINKQQKTTKTRTK
eukprot:c10643_g1_i2.p1 GENE.c10643_g1_i2~~c10643_g1_i2.p1  ORF type:complete len:120 (+),score=34.07 c10643_g1_i2:531-890(+)